MGLASAAPAADTGAPTAATGAVRVGDMAPDFALEFLDGRTLRLSEHLGNTPVLLIFWSYFCFPCQRELPELAELERELGPREVTVLGVSLDGPQFDEKIRPFLAAKAITFPNAYDRETETYFEVAERYGVVGTPTTFVLDPQGRIRFIHLGRLEASVAAGIVRGVRDPSFCAEILKPQRAP